MKAFRRLVILGTALAALSNVAFGYYHWTYFVSRSGPFNPIRKKFDLNAIPGGVVPFFIARQGPSKMVDGDNFQALVTQIRRAAESWNVTGPAIKTQFAGFTDTAYLSALTDQATPAIDVVFDDDMVPGVLAQTLPKTYDDLHFLAGKDSPGFAPILRSRVQLASDLTTRGQSSYSDVFFTTIVHEFGHALGLQHSLTNGAMSTSIIRATSKAQPVTPDDIAGLALLYPTTDFLTQTGSINGHVTVAGKDGNLVSVVALRQSDGLVIGSMTQPDGNYRIDGLPPGDYIVYAHPLPPIQLDGGDAAGIQAPTDLDQAPFVAAANFQTRFAGNGGTATKNWTEAAHFLVQAGKLTASRADFSLDRVSSAGPYNANIYGFVGPGGTTVLAPPLPAGYKNWLLFLGQNVITGPSKIVPGLQLSAIGSAATLDQASMQTWDSYNPNFPLIVATANPVDRATQVAVAFTVGDALYVSPRAFSVVPSQHPRITSITQGTDNDGQQVALIAGENMDLNKVLFDGAEALRVVKKADGTLEVLPPPATSAYSSVVELLGPDGQTSWQIQQYDLGFPIRYTSPATGPNSYTLSDGGIIAGTDQMIEIRGNGTNFLNGRTAVGFGTADVVVRQMWVLGPDRIWLNVSANPKAKLGNVAVTISTGLQTVTDGIAFQVRARPGNQISLLAPLVNDATGLAGVPGGGTIAMRGTGLPATAAVGWIASVGGVFRDVRRGDDGVLRVSVPPTLAPGPNLIQMWLPTGEAAPQVLFQLDVAAPVLQSISKIGAASATVVYAADRVSLKVTGIDGADPASLEIRVGGVLQTLEAIGWDKDTSTYTLEFTLTDTVVPGDSLPVTLRVGTRLSAPIPLSVGAVRPIGQ